MLKIVTVPNNVLSSPTKPVVKIDDKIKKIVSDMEKVLIAQNDPPGVGLAANQVGLDLSIFIIRPTEKSKIKVFVNPKIIQTSAVEDPPAGGGKTAEVKKKKKRVKLEGCLSIPRIWGSVKRADKVLLEYQDITEAVIKGWFQGFEAVIIQHEMDHLFGVVFTQRVIEQKKQLYREEEDELVKIEY